ncbi:MAG: DsbA family protein [Nitrospinota bacterium]
MTKSVFLAFVGLSVLTLSCIQPAFAQSGEELKALRKEVEALKKEQKTIKQQLRAIQNLLQRRRAARSPVQNVSVVIDIADEPFKGSKNAKLTLIEFSDYECPFSARHFRQTMPELEKNYIQTGKVKYVLRDFPIVRIHRRAFKAHEAANCAEEQGKYWEVHDRTFANRKAMTPKDLVNYAQASGLAMTEFQQCFESGKYAAEIQKDIQDGRKAGVRGTPSFFLGFTDPSDSKMKAVRMIRGALPYSSFKQVIDSLLSSKK